MEPDYGHITLVITAINHNHDANHSAFYGGGERESERDINFDGTYKDPFWGSHRDPKKLLVIHF